MEVSSERLHFLQRTLRPCAEYFDLPGGNAAHGQNAQSGFLLGHRLQSETRKERRVSIGRRTAEQHARRVTFAKEIGSIGHALGRTGEHDDRIGPLRNLSGGEPTGHERDERSRRAHT